MFSDGQWPEPARATPEGGAPLAGARHSAVSKQVAALEHALGARLLSRTTRFLALTEEDQRYFVQAQRLVAEIAEAESVVRGASQQLSGWLRVAKAVGLGRMALLPIVQRVLADHRGVKVDLRLNDGFVDLVEVTSCAAAR